MDEDIQGILDKYKGKLKENIQEIDDYSPDKNYTKEYQKFRKEALTKKFTTYESLCNFSGRLLNIQPKEKNYNRLQSSIDIAHLNITPSGAYSFAILSAIILFLIAHLKKFNCPTVVTILLVLL